MSNRVKLKSRTARNLKVLLARASAKVEPGHGYIAHIRHDPDCLGLAHQSVLRCKCKPQIAFKRVT